MTVGLWMWRYCYVSKRRKPLSQRNNITSQKTNAQQQRSEELKIFISEILYFEFRCAVFRLFAFETKLLTALKNVCHYSGRADVSSSHFLINCQKYTLFSLITTWQTLLTKIASDMKQSQRTSSLHIICRIKAVCFSSKICRFFVGSSSEPRSRDFYHSFPKFTPIILKSSVFTSMMYVGCCMWDVLV